MGLMDFVSSVGKKLGIDYFEQQAALEQATADADRVQKEAALRDQMNATLTNAVGALGLSISGLKISMKGKVAHVSGTATSQSDKEKALMCIGNHAGVDQIDDGGFSVVTPEPPGLFHTVVKGDTLSLISQRYYGIIMAYPEVALANQPLIENADKITPGWIISIPAMRGIHYITKKGDTLGGIAKTMYGDAKKYPLIFDANQGTLTSPDVVTPGMDLLIPVLHALPDASQPNV
jgi:nucleoid-associated protein YgaU